MTTFILILYVLGGNRAVHMTTIPGFNSDADCTKAGNTASNKIGNGIEFVCIGQAPKVGGK